MTKLNAFGEACVDMNTADDLRVLLGDQACILADCNEWSMSEAERREQILLAITYLENDNA